MKHNFVIKFVLVCIAFSIIQQVSGDLADFRYDGDELFDIDKRQPERFRNRHVFSENPELQHGDDFWDNEAYDRLNDEGIYGPNRPQQTFIRVSHPGDIMDNFDGQQQCADGGFRSTDAFHVVQMKWYANVHRYFVINPGDQQVYHICAALENGQPVHYFGKE